MAGRRPAPPVMMESGSQTRRLLLIGFGGLLILLAFAGLNGISVVNAIENRNERIRADYVSRERVLEQLRSDIYLSGTYVRDLLLERDPALADQHREELERAKSRINANSSTYAQILLTSERAPFQQFVRELTRYFELLDPALRWSPAQRERLGYAFMKQSLLPRRTEIVRLADELSNLNQKQLATGDRQVRELFASFRHSLVIVLIFFLFCGGVLAGVSIYRLLRLETISSIRFQEVVQARTALRDLSARLVGVQESERRAISRELHDEVGQAVSGLLLGIGNVAVRLSPETDSGALGQLGDLRRLAERTVAVVRDMSLLLRPSMLDDLGLLPALQWQAREVSRTKNVSVQVFAGEVSEETLSDEQKTCIYRVVQEALQNAVRHAQAKSVKIHLAESASKLALVVQDDGRGFEPGRDRGVGLLGMEERVHYLNGTFAIKSQPGSGTSICVGLPLPKVSNVRTS